MHFHEKKMRCSVAAHWLPDYVALRAEKRKKIMKTRTAWISVEKGPWKSRWGVQQVEDGGAECASILAAEREWAESLEESVRGYSAGLQQVHMLNDKHGKLL